MANIQISQHRRLAALEAKRVATVKSILVTFKPNPAPVRIVGAGMTWAPEPGESTDAFRRRAQAEARPRYPRSIAVLLEEYS